MYLKYFQPFLNITDDVYTINNHVSEVIEQIIQYLDNVEVISETLSCSQATQGRMNSLVFISQR